MIIRVYLYFSLTVKGVNNLDKLYASIALFTVLSLYHIFLINGLNMYLS